MIFGIAITIFLIALFICIIARMKAKTDRINAETARINAQTEFYRRKEYDKIKSNVDLSAAIDSAAKQYERNNVK